MSNVSLAIRLVFETSTFFLMSKLYVRCFGVSLDGYGAGPNQDLQNPLGVGGGAMFQWFFPTRTFHTMHGNGTEGTTDINDEFARRGFENIGAWILGRNMFGPIRGVWPDDQWKGWWGDEPPYHVPVFVLTHHARAPLVMAGGTTFYFVTEGIEVALQRAREAAGGKDVRVGGGVSTVRQYLSKSLIDEMHLAVAPVFMGRGENLFAGLDLTALGYQSTEHIPGPGVTHVIVKRK
jgi:dihydrofolate reductase